MGEPIFWPKRVAERGERGVVQNSGCFGAPPCSQHINHIIITNTRPINISNSSNGSSGGGGGGFGGSSSSNSGSSNIFYILYTPIITVFLSNSSTMI